LLAEHAARVTILARGDALGASMSAYLIDQLAATPTVEVRLRTRVADGWGRHRLEGLVLEGAASGRTEEVPAAAPFVLIGAAPRTDWLDGVVARDEGGYVLACRDLTPRCEPLRPLWPRRDRGPFTLEASLPGVFAVGDVRHNSVKRVASAVGAGAMAIFAVHAYLAEEAA
jgi:thioredoxin reductase (NADPH)